MLARLEYAGKLLPEASVTSAFPIFSASTVVGSFPSELEDRLDEFLRAERYYVHQLGTLDILRASLEANSAIGGDDLSAIFGCFGPLLEFHRHHLARLEQIRIWTSSLDAWVSALNLEEEAFSIHETYALNIRRAFTVALERFDNIFDAAMPPKVYPIHKRRGLLLSALAEPIVHIGVYESVLNVCQS